MVSWRSSFACILAMGSHPGPGPADLSTDGELLGTEPSQEHVSVPSLPSAKSSQGRGTPDAEALHSESSMVIPSSGLVDSGLKPESAIGDRPFAADHVRDESAAGSDGDRDENLDFSNGLALQAMTALPEPPCKCFSLHCAPVALRSQSSREGRLWRHHARSNAHVCLKRLR